MVLFITTNIVALEVNVALLPIEGLVFIFCLAASGKRWPENRWNVIWLALAVAAACLVHNACVMLVPAILIVLYPTLSGQSWFRRLVVAAVFCVASLGPYFATWLSEFLWHTGSGSKKLENVFDRALERAPQWVASMGGIFVPTKPQHLIQTIVFFIGVAFVAWMVWIVIFERDPVIVPLKAPLTLALLFAIGFYVAFSVIYEPVKGFPGRHFWYLALVVAGPLCIWVWQRRSPPAMLGLYVLLFAAELWHVQLFVRRSVIAQKLSFPVYHGVIYREYFLTSRPDAKVPPGYIAILPPTFPWMSRWQGGTNEEDQKLVHRREN
jgi:hypothetical protein